MSESKTIYKFEYEVKRLEPGQCKYLPNGGYIATTPYRMVDWGGETEEEAIGSMLYGLCDLVKRGCLDPDDPHAAATSAASEPA